MATDKANTRIKELLKKLSLTQKQLVASSGLAPSLIRKKINQTDDQMTVEDLELLSHAMGISLFDVFNSTEFYPQNSQDKPFKQVLQGYFHNKRINKRYEIIGYDHAGDILKCYPEERNDLRLVLDNLDITMGDIITGGGNESGIPKKIRTEFLKHNWIVEQQVDGTLQVDLTKI